MTDEDDELFVAVLRADLPTAHQQDLMRKRLFAAGLSVSTGLATMSATSVAEGSAAASALGTTSVLSKLGALSWPAKVGLAAALATPVMSVPLWLTAPPARSTVSASSPAAPPARKKTSIEAMSQQAAATVPTPTPPPELREPAVANPAPAPRRAEVARAVAAERSAVATVAAPIASGAAAFAPVEAPVASLAQQRATTLAAETALLDRAFAEIGAGHRAAAASLIAEHARRFPQGLLRQERERAQARLSAELIRDSKGE